MMDMSVFTDKKRIPNDNDLVDALGNTYPLWQTIMDYVHSKYPKALDEWNYPGAKYGWSYRIKDRKRAILYFLYKIIGETIRRSGTAFLPDPISGTLIRGLGF